MALARGKFFDPNLIARISRLELMAQRIVDGFLAGKNRSSRHGFSVEFVEHREYSPGDDLRHLDWKVLGRMDRYYVKRYEEETNITAVLLLDASASMTYGSGAMSKFELGASAASALAYLLHKQRDAVGLVLFDDEIRAYAPPSAKRTTFANLTSRLLGAVPQGKSGLKSVIERVLHDVPRRALYILASDLFVPADELEAVIKLLTHEGNDLIVLHTLDPAERTFPFRSNTLFRGLEDRRELLTEPHRLRTRYLQALEKFLDDARRITIRCAQDYQLITTGEDLGPVLSSLLALRARRRPGARHG